MGRVDEYHAGYFRRELGRKCADILSPYGVPNQHIGTGHGSPLQQFM